MDRLERVAMCLFMDQHEKDAVFTKKQKRELQQEAFLDWPCLCASAREKWINKAREHLEGVE